MCPTSSRAPLSPQVLARAAEGDASAWTQLVEAYSSRVFGLLIRQCRDEELAEELTQATFVKLVDKLGSDDAGYTEQGKFEAYMFRIAMNKLRDEMRRRKRQATPIDMSPGAVRGERGSTHAEAPSSAGHATATPPLAPDAALEHADELDRLRAAVATLPEADQEILHLRHTAGLSFAQIAETLDQPLGTVLARAHRAVGKLRKQFEETED